MSMKETFHPNGVVKSRWYYDPGEKDVFMSFRDDGTLRIEQHFKDGVLHNPTGPAFIMYDKDEDMTHFDYYIHGTKHKSLPRSKIKNESKVKLSKIELALKELFA